MSEDTLHENGQEAPMPEGETPEGMDTNTTQSAEATAENTEAAANEAEVELTPEEKLEQRISELEREKSAINDKHLRLYAEFENFRKRTNKEKLDMLGNAAGDTIKNVLPVLDDLERATHENKNYDDVEVMREAFDLIEKEMRHILSMQGLKPMESKGKEFDVDHHEAIARTPAPKKKLKGKVIDVIEPGYFLNDKVLRYAKVVVGE